MPPRPLSFADRARSYLAGAAATVPLIGASLASRIGPAEPFSGGPQGKANPPSLAINVDQPIPTPEAGAFRFDPAYHGHTFQNTAAPVFYGNMTLARARAALEMHDAGASFLESSIFTMAAMRFPPVFWALGIRCAPLISLPRQILGGPRGLARAVALEVEDQIARRHGLLPSPYFPATLWGAIAIDLAMMGFCVLQHVYGPPDARGVRRIYTRRWPTWAVYFHAYRRTYIALTNDGPIDITNDGKFTIIGKTDVPHMQGAIRALVLPTLDGAQVMQARAQWIDRFSDPKLAMFMPPNVNVQGDEGKAMYAAARDIRGPGGFGVFPNGSVVEWTGLDAKASACFKDALGSDSAMINSILTGVDTAADGGVYKPLVFWGILRSTVGDDLASTVRGVNLGHIYPYTQFNYAEGIAEDTDRGVWVDPVLSVPLPDPEKDERITEDDKRANALIARIVARREAGIVTTQDDADALADALETPRVVLTAVKFPKVSITDTDRAKAYRVREIREGDGAPPLGTPEKPDPRDDLMIPELDAIAKQNANVGPQDNLVEIPDETSRAVRWRGGSVRSGLDVWSAPRMGASIHSVKFDTSKAHAVYIRDGYECQYCGKHDASEHGKGLSIDHIDARARGGAAQNTKGTPATNLVTACGSCNSAKQDRTPRQWNEYQKASGQAPPPTDWSALRKQAAKPIDIKAGEKNAATAKSARDATKAEKEKAEKSPEKKDGGGDKPTGPGIRHDDKGRFKPGN